jgi:regulator of sirC expression with transglutaminase-like and TPR domain
VIEVGRRLGLELVPVGMPGHFLVGVGHGRFVDAFDGGRLIDEAGARERFTELAGAGTPWSPALLAPTGSRAVLARVLGNLRGIFAGARDLAALDRVMELRLAVPGVPDRERAERASVLAALGRYAEAGAELERLADVVTGSDEELDGPFAAEQLRAQAARLRARLN